MCASDGAQIPRFGCIRGKAAVHPPSIGSAKRFQSKTQQRPRHPTRPFTSRFPYCLSFLSRIFPAVILSGAINIWNIFFAFCLQWILPLPEALWIFPSIFCSFGKIMGSSAQVFILLPLLLNRSSCAMLLPSLPAIGFGLLTHPPFTGARPAAVRLVMHLFGLLPFTYIRELYINFRNASLLGG